MAQLDDLARMIQLEAERTSDRASDGASEMVMAQLLTARAQLYWSDNLFVEGYNRALQEALAQPHNIQPLNDAVERAWALKARVTAQYSSDSALDVIPNTTTGVVDAPLPAFPKMWRSAPQSSSDPVTPAAALELPEWKPLHTPADGELSVMLDDSHELLVQQLQLEIQGLRASKRGLQQALVTERHHSEQLGVQLREARQSLSSERSTNCELRLDELKNWRPLPVPNQSPANG